MFKWPSLFKGKKNPQHDLEELIQALQKQSGIRLKSIVLFGSMASGEFQDSHSDINLLIVIDDAALPSLESLSKVLQPWIGQGHTLPILLTVGELPAFSRALPIEFLDILDHHRIVAGENVLQNLSVDSQHLRAHCEQQLALILLKLRQAVAVAGGNEAKIRELLMHSIPSVLTLYRAILRLKEKVGKMSKIEAAERLARLAGIDAGELRQLQEFHFSRQTDNLQDFMGHYLAEVEKVFTYLQSL